MITIKRKYWLITRDVLAPQPPIDETTRALTRTYFSWEEAKRGLEIVNHCYPKNVFFIAEHQKDLDIEENTCGYCGAKEGDFHDIFCDHERCPFCSGQLITCGCVYDLLNIRDRVKYNATTNYLPPKIYSQGLTKKQTKDWIALLEKKGRVHFIRYPNLCSKCGKLWPTMFMVPDEEWEHYVQPAMRDTMLCMDCYTTIKYLTDLRT